MKNLLKLSVVAAVLVASATFASAITINSSSETVMYNGYVQGSSPYNDLNPFADISYLPGVATANIGTGGVWSDPIAGTSWVSNNAQSFPGGSYTAPNGYYTYTSTFSAVAGDYTGFMQVMADDTVAAFLNGSETPFLFAGAIGGDGKCADVAPNCTTVKMLPLSLALNSTNTFTFVVEQTGGSGEGLDFAATLSPAAVPEPSSLLMLGTGLLGSAGALFRRMRS